MAVLKNNGKELIRLVKELKDSDYFTNNKTYVALFENRWVLSKDIGTQKPDSIYPNGKNHSWGWKRIMKVKEGVTIEQFVNFFEKKGFHVL